MNRLAQNRLAQNRLAQNRLAQNRLAQNSLSSTRLVALAETAQLLETADGREVYSYIVSCALPPEMTIEKDVAGAPDTAFDDPYVCVNEHCTFNGGVGLAPEWIDHRLTNRGRRWISACLFSRVNFHDTAEAISLRGRHAALTITQDEAELYTLQEGAFFGNLFNNPHGPIDWNACRGEAEAAGGEPGGLALRDCTEEDPATPGYTLCGFRYAGDCRDFTPATPSDYACKTYDTSLGAYSQCQGPKVKKKNGHGDHDDDDDDDNCHGHGHKYREVITVYASN